MIVRFVLIGVSASALSAILMAITTQFTEQVFIQFASRVAYWLEDYVGSRASARRAIDGALHGVMVSSVALGAYYVLSSAVQPAQRRHRDGIRAPLSILVALLSTALVNALLMQKMSYPIRGIAREIGCLISDQDDMRTTLARAVFGALHAVVLAPLAIGIFTIVKVFSRRRVSDMNCLRCSYDVRASIGRCPECGEPIRGSKPS